MKVTTMSMEKAISYTPTPPSIMVHILNSQNQSITFPKDKYYNAVFRYVFDDIESLNDNLILINQDIIKNIYKDFSQLFKLISKNDYELVVHCHQGISRTPAFVLGLNKLFNIGLNEEEFKLNHKYFNKKVYNSFLTFLGE